MSLEEHKVFTENYARICSTLTDIDDLLLYFVQKKIIKPEDQDDIKTSAKTKEKVNKLLKHISGPLQAGDSKGFYTMLDIMKNHGSQATKDLSETLKATLSIGIVQSSEISKQKLVLAIPHKPTNRHSAQFSSLVRTVENVLDESSKKLEACKRFCLYLTISDNSDILLFSDEQLKKIKICTSFRALFELLRKHWSWKEYYILKHIISEAESKEAKDELEKYEKMMSSYFGLQLIAESFSPDELPNEYIKMTIIVDKPYKELTLQNFIELRNFIFEQMDVKPYIAHPFIKFLFSSLHLEWYVLQQAVPHMIEMSCKNIGTLKEFSIIYIKIGEKILLDIDITLKVKSDNEVCGLTFTFVELLPCELICKICKLPCKNPQISLCCKNNFCEGHLETVFGGSTHSQCPMCDSEKFEAFPDAQADERIQALMVYCPNKDAGCNWIGKLSQVNEHCNSDHLGCIFQEVKCPSKCGVLLQRKDLENHLAADCPCYCQYCETIGDKILIAKHHKEKCQKFTVQCPNGCGATMLREEMNEHMKICPLEEIQCEYYNLGCQGLMLRKDREEHNKNNVIQHLDLMKKKFSNTTATRFYGIIFILLMAFMIIQCSYMGIQYHEMSDQKLQCYKMEDSYHEMTSEYNEMEEKYHEMTLEFQEIKEKCREMENKLNQQLDKLKNETKKFKVNISDKLKGLNSKLKILENEVMDYATSEEINLFASSLRLIHDEVMEAVDEQTKEVNRLGENFNKLEISMNKSYKNLSLAVDRNYKQIISSSWHIHLNIFRLLALLDNQVVPVVLVISNYSEWVKEKEAWYSPFFLDTRDGNQFCLSVKPAKTELFITLHLATYSRKHKLLNGTFIIEVLNLISDSNHSIGEMHFSKASLSVLKLADDIKLFEKKIVGNLKHRIPQYKENVTYILRDELFLRVSFYVDY